MSKFTSQDNENVVNIETNHGSINLPKKDEPKNEKHAPNHLYGFFGLLAFFGLVVFAIIYSAPIQLPKPPYNSNIITDSGIIQNSLANSNVNSSATAPPVEKDSQIGANIRSDLVNKIPTPNPTPIRRIRIYALKKENNKSYDGSEFAKEKKSASKKINSIPEVKDSDIKPE